MNWTRVLAGGVSAGFVTFLGGFVMHGIMLADTYKRYNQVFTQTETNPAWFFLVSVAIATAAAVLFAKTRQTWEAGWKGGLTFGFYLGLAGFFISFYHPLVIDGFPYYLGWCWGGIHLINSLLGGAILGVLIRRD
ncbi:MAG TPA: hypothetical protein VF017_03725 [Thermoanaerobaculia bacterium]|nr:hypothetical protein [Thermoanaerobaculia bacterium]